jgi:hypothetical protein
MNGLSDPHGKGGVSARVWDLIVKYGPGIAVIVGAIWTLVTWYQQREDALATVKRQTQQAHEIALRESQKPFLEKQLAFYFEAARVTSKLATPDPRAGFHEQPASEVWTWARKRFWELYWGELGVVESPQVASAMVNFGNTLKEVEKCGNSDELCAERQRALTGASLDLAHSIREDIEKGWGYSLPSVSQ